MNTKKIGKRDPQGYYVIMANKQALELVKNLPNVLVEDLGKGLMIRTRSRSTAKRILHMLESKGLSLDVNKD